MAEEEKAVDSVDSTDTGGVSTGGGAAITESTGGAPNDLDQPVFADGKPFTWKPENGEMVEFSKRGQLNEYLRHSGMRREDLDREMGKVSARGKYLEEQIKKTEDRAKELEGSDGARYHKFLTGRPDIAAKIKEAMGQGGEADLRRVVGEIMKPIIDKQAGYDKAEEGRAADGRRSAARVRMAEAYPGFDESLVQAELKRIQDIPPADMEYALYELMHNVVQGRTNPAELERRAAEAAARPTTPSVTSTPGVKPTGRDPNDMTAAEKREAGVRLLEKHG